MNRVHPNPYLLVATVLFAVHSFEEIAGRYWVADPTSNTVADWFGVSSATVYGIGQVALFSVLTYGLWLGKQTGPRWRTAFSVLALLELIHFVPVNGEHPASYTAIPLIIFGLVSLYQLRHKAA